jgi:glycerophosphoryl diester phosphodiesterase
MFKFSVLTCCFLMLGFVSHVSAEKVQIIAHRGASAYAPENTLAAVNLAWEMDADAVEVDVHQSKDGRIIVCHDTTTKRTSGGIDLKISETPAAELRQLDVGLFKGRKFAGEKLPFLEEVIATVPKGKQLFVEVKCGQEIIPALKTMLRESGKIDRMVVIGFGLDTMSAVKKAIPEVPVYWLAYSEMDKETNTRIPSDPVWIKWARENGVDGLNVHHEGVHAEFAKAVLDSGMGFYVWTVNSPEDARRLIALGVQGITTDKPDLLEGK